MWYITLLNTNISASMYNRGATSTKVLVLVFEVDFVWRTTNQLSSLGVFDNDVTAQLKAMWAPVISMDCGITNTCFAFLFSELVEIY